jgi:hypothetical protein
LRERVAYGRDAAARSARSSASGSFFPRLSARRRIPAHAFGLKKNRGGTLPVSSSTSDNEHTPPSLWDGTRVRFHSDVLSVHDSVREPVPELDQRPEEGSKVPSAVRRQDAGHVFPDDVARPDSINQAQIREGEIASRIGKSLA